MRILVACEESQIVTTELLSLGHDAYSCDTKECSGKHKERHLQQDVTPLLNDDWDMIIAFPPCTHLANSGARWFKEKKKDGRQQSGINFFMQFANCNCRKVAIENPVGIMSTIYRKPDQIIQPFEYGDPYKKTTCLWLKGLPQLRATNTVCFKDDVVFNTERRMSAWYYDTSKMKHGDRSYIRSKTPHGIALAMATQWAGENKEDV